MIKNQSIAKFLKELSSSSPTPGGGSAAAIVGAFAASLVEMVAGLTIGKKGYDDVQIDVKKIKRQASGLRNRLLVLSDKDADAFNVVMKAYKSKNSQKIQKALRQATEIPLQTAQLISRVLNLAKIVNKIGNRNAASDSLSALYLSKASIFAALENIKINLGAINDNEFKETVEKKIEDLNLPNCRCE